MPERKPTRRLHRTTRTTLTLRLSRLQPGQEVRLRVIQPGRKQNRKRRAGRNRVVITSSDCVGLEIVDIDT